MKVRKFGMLQCRMIFMLLFLIGIFAFPSYADEAKKVRVGYYNDPGYHTVSQHNYHEGYDYEYLMEIAKYTGWDYEFVEGTWEECVERLERGEIDLLGGVQKNKERLMTMRFATMPSIYVSNCLLIDSASQDYIYEDFEGFNGMTIGALSGSTLNDSLEDYATEHGFTYQLERYDTEKELREALERGDIDCVYLSDMRNLKDYKVIGKFGYAPLYYAVSAPRRDLADELNEALYAIHTDQHYYEGKLFEKYFTIGARNALTVAEKQYIQEHGTVTVALVDGFPLICERDLKTGQYTGIIMDVLNEVARRTGLSFTYIKMPMDVVPSDYMAANPNVVMAPFLNNSLVDYSEEIRKLDTVVQGRMIGVKRADASIDFDEGFVLAVPRHMLDIEKKVQALFPNAHLIYGDSHEDCLQMVSAKEADMTLISEITSTYLLQSPYYNELATFHTESIIEDISMALASESDPLLISILNKAILSFNERDVRQIVVDNTVSRAYKMTPAEWLYENGGIIMLLTVMALGAAVTLVKRKERLERERAEQEQLHITEERLRAEQEHQKTMFRQANFDSLTGLYNQEYFILRTKELLKRNPHKTYTMFMINVEKFKLINQVFGRRRGDLVVLKIAEDLRNRVGKKGVYGRLYADRFALCYPVDEQELKELAIDDVGYIECDGQQMRIQTNIGIYCNTEHERNADKLLEYAQIAMQKGVELRSGHIHFYRDEYLKSMLREQRITNEMEDALADGQFQFYLQPQYDHVAKTLVGAEALVRWIHPEWGMVSPADFIPVFEKNGFIVKLDKYICEQVCALLAQWQKRGIRIPISMNLSKYDIHSPEIVADLKHFLERYDIPVELLHLEITESAYADNHGELISVVEQLKNQGFTIEMDDFGSEYSSLNMLKDVPVDILKLDMKFFSGETRMDRGGSIVESVVRLAHAIGVPVIAEGVETEREANFLQSVDCRMVQGYLYGKPMPVEAFEELLAASAIGEKRIAVRESGASVNTYWALEKYNILQCSEPVSMFEYDPVTDYLMLTYNEGGNVKEYVLNHYLKHMMHHSVIHPDYREMIVELLQNGSREVQHIRFLANYNGAGNYIWCDAEVHSYYRGKTFSRLIAVVREAKKENS